MESRRGERMEAKLDKVAEDINEIKIIQARQADSLIHHIKRTDILEGMVTPVVEFMVMVKGVTKLIGIIAVAAGIIEGIVALLEYLSHVK